MLGLKIKQTPHWDTHTHRHTHTRSPSVSVRLKTVFLAVESSQYIFISLNLWVRSFQTRAGWAQPCVHVTCCADAQIKRLSVVKVSFHKRLWAQWRLSDRGPGVQMCEECYLLSFCHLSEEWGSPSSSSAGTYELQHFLIQQVLCQLISGEGYALMGPWNPFPVASTASWGSSQHWRVSLLSVVTGDSFSSVTASALQPAPRLRGRQEHVVLSHFAAASILQLQSVQWHSCRGLYQQVTMSTVSNKVCGLQLFSYSRPDFIVEVWDGSFQEIFSFGKRVLLIKSLKQLFGWCPLIMNIMNLELTFSYSVVLAKVLRILGWWSWLFHLVSRCKRSVFSRMVKCSCTFVALESFASNLNFQR